MRLIVFVVVGGLCGCGPVLADDFGVEDTVHTFCADGGQWGVSVEGESLHAFEGHRVWMAAVEPKPFEDVGVTDEVVARVGSRVVDGRVAMACAQSLSENNVYPTLAVVVDLDDDGGCSEGDLQWIQNFYAWADDVHYRIVDDEVWGLESDPPWRVEEEIWEPVTDDLTVWGDTPFCDYFFAP